MTAEQARKNLDEYIKEADKRLLADIESAIEEASKKGDTNLPVNLREALKYKEQEVIQHFTSLGYKVTKEPLSRIRISWA